MEPILIISTVLLWIVVLFNMLLTFGIVRRISKRPSIPEMETLRVGGLAPEFSAETLARELVTSNQFMGQELALVFMASACTPCKDKLPELVELAAKMERKGSILALVFKQPSDEVQQFIDELQLTMLVLVAPAPNSLFADYKVPGTPFFCIVNEYNKIASNGFLGSGEWNKYIQKFIG